MHKHMHMTCDMWQDRSPPACNYAYRFRPDRGRSLAWSARTAPRAMMRYVNGFSSVFKEPLLPLRSSKVLLGCGGEELLVRAFYQPLSTTYLLFTFEHFREVLN